VQIKTDQKRKPEMEEQLEKNAYLRHGLMKPIDGISSWPQPRRKPS
jgi:hypothetical protein